MTPEQEIRRAEEAGAILRNPYFVEAMGTIKKDIIDKWAACPARDTEGREWLWQHYQVAVKFEQIFEEFINSGKLAREFVRQKTISERVKAAWGGK